MAASGVLYDGWSLVYQPASPAALHLLEILSVLPPEVSAWVALPGDAPPWLPEAARPVLSPAPPTARSQLAWEQRTLPTLQRQLGVNLLHLTRLSPPLFTGQPTLLSPCEAGLPLRPAGLAARLRTAFAAGGLARLRLTFWPADLPAPQEQLAVQRLPPFTSFSVYASMPQVPLDLPQAYILYHGPYAPDDLQRLLQAWSWAAGPIGDQYPLLLVGLDRPAQDQLAILLRQYDLGESVRALPALPPGCLAALYRGSTALFHPAQVTPWGSPLRLALACARPLVAVTSDLTDALVGPAAYLLQPGDARGLGAALITLVVEEDVSQRLAQLARQRADAWEAGFASKLTETYSRLIA